MKKSAFLLLAFLLVSSFIMADTGKYRIIDYQVTLTPYSDGRVKMDYYQKWQVTDGHIPWITVGMPNDDYKITGSSLAVKKIQSQSDDGSFVRIDLDKDYQPGQSFEIAFSVDETRLFYTKDSLYCLDFTPGWYERAFIDTLSIQVNCFFKLDLVKTDPKPLVAKDGVIVWQKNKLAKGEKYEVKLYFPQRLYPKQIAEANLKAGISLGFIILLVLGVLFVVALISVFSDDDGSYSGGGIFFGGSSGSSSLSGSGGGGFGGSSSSCACACVSCACACACAGGGGAGCSRKTEHKCPICNPKKP